MKLSVAICTYNGAKYLKQQLLSILSQNLTVDEIVVCDDCSTDNTLEIIHGIADKYRNVEWNIQRNSHNLGVTKNFEKAISSCSGDIIFLSDQDDLWRLDKTQIIVDFFCTNNNKSVVFSDASLIDGGGESMSEHSLLDAVGLLPNIQLYDAGFDLELLNLKNRATGATMAIRKTFARYVMPFIEDKNFLHDYQLAFVAACSNQLGLIKEKLIGYRIHGENVVGIHQRNWIFSGSAMQVPYWNVIVEPLPINLVYRTSVRLPRLNFYIHRTEWYSSISGKFKLFSLIPAYRRYYHRYWINVFLSDLLYGISSRLTRIIGKKGIPVYLFTPPVVKD